MGALPPRRPTGDTAHASDATRLFVGCYTAPSHPGIHIFDADATGSMTRRGVIDAVEHASFLALRPDTATLYAVRECDPDGAVVALRLDGLDPTVINEVESRGAAPCYVSVDERRVYVANYGSGTVAAYALRPDGGIGELIATHQHDGSGPHARQDAPHAHCIVPGPDGASVYAADLGTDRIIRYVDHPDGRRFEPAGTTPMAPGSGPRHVRFHPTLPIALVVCELDCTLVVADVDTTTGRLDPRRAVSTLPAGTTGEPIAAEVTLHPDGTTAYVSNRGHDSIAVFAIDPHEPPELVAHVASGGRTPRHIAIHPAGRTLLAANQHSDTIVSFELDDAGVPTHAEIVAELHQPVCLTFVGAAP